MSSEHENSIELSEMKPSKEQQASLPRQEEKNTTEPATAATPVTERANQALVNAAPSTPLTPIRGNELRRFQLETFGRQGPDRNARLSVSSGSIRRPWSPTDSLAAAAARAPGSSVAQTESTTLRDFLANFPEAATPRPAAGRRPRRHSSLFLPPLRPGPYFGLCLSDFLLCILAMLAACCALWATCLTLYRLTNRH
ncbi:hypothetical protein F5Y05DRAFT_420877 [Hypoxylon sp. FL0543]|nr:hypothetical protein F5Y05DRAFT_420877 [Hypoxylon sp. FL0543]